MSTDLVVVMCPSLSDYPEAPKDHSHSELRDCPKCKNKMWLSQKKNGALMFASCLNKEILLACYACITKIAAKDPSFFMNAEKVDL